MTFFAGLGAVELATLMGMFVLGGMVKGALGFGLPLVTMAVLPLVIPVNFALALNAMILPFMNIAQLVNGGQVRQTLYRFRHLNIGILIGVPLGAAFVSVVSDSMLMLILGVFVILFILLTVVQPQMSVPAEREGSIGAGVGVAAGVLGALTTASGPLFVMYLLGLRVDRGLFVSALSLFFIITGVLISGAFWLAGIIELEQLAVVALCMPAAFAGMSLGSWIGERVPAKRFRALVLGVLGLLAVNLIFQALSDL